MAKGKILVVDDQQDVRDVMRLHLEGAGYNILEAENGEEAIRALKDGDNMSEVGIILCDIRMPKVNGAECIEILRKEAPDIPVVVVTCFPDTDVADSFLKKGAKDCLVKPVEKNKLLDTVNKVINAEKDTNL